MGAAWVLQPLALPQSIVQVKEKPDIEEVKPILGLLQASPVLALAEREASARFRRATPVCLLFVFVSYFF